MPLCDVAFRTALAASLFAASAASIDATPAVAQEMFSIELRPDLVLGEATGVSFGGGLHVAVDGEGRIYVGDSMNRNVRVFSADAGFLVAFIQQGPGTLRVHHVDGEGAVSPRVILEAKAREAVAKVGAGGMSVVRTSPLFGREALLGMTPDDELFYGWSEAIDFTFYDGTGKWIGVYKSDSPRLPVTDCDIKHELEGSSPLRRRVLQGAEHAETKPAIHTFIVDDNGWIWTGRLKEDPAVTQWWVHQRMTRISSAILTLPEYVDLQVVRGEYAYAVPVDEVGCPTVVRYGVDGVGAGA